MKILVTGFEPFGGEGRNPSAEVVKALPGTIAGAELAKAILPVVRFEAPKLLKEAVEVHRPEVVLSVGQAGGRSAVSIERVAVNLDDYRIPDNAGNQPREEVVVAGGPDAWLCRLPVKRMAEEICAAGIPAQVSLSAGSYVCNHVFYCACRMMEELRPGGMAGFIHIPYLPEQVTDKPGSPSMSLEMSVRAVEIAIETIVKEARR